MAQTKLSIVSQFTGICVKHRGAPVSSNSRFQTAPVPQHSANLAVSQEPTWSPPGSAAFVPRPAGLGVAGALLPPVGVSAASCGVPNHNHALIERHMLQTSCCTRSLRNKALQTVLGMGMGMGMNVTAQPSHRAARLRPRYLAPRCTLRFCNVMLVQWCASDGCSLSYIGFLAPRNGAPLHAPRR